MENPTVLGSGIVGVSKASLTLASKNGAGAVTLKSLTSTPRKGHPAPVILTYEAGMINSVGYSNPGINNVEDEFSNLENVGVPVIGSITGKDEKDFALLAEKADELDFKAVEMVLSCPHTPGYGSMAGQSTPEVTEKLTRIVKDNTSKPVFVKLSPNIMGISEIAKAAENGGADAITAVNTLGPGMFIDVKSKKTSSGRSYRRVKRGCFKTCCRPVCLRRLQVSGNSNNRNRRRFERRTRG